MSYAQPASTRRPPWTAIAALTALALTGLATLIPMQPAAAQPGRHGWTCRRENRYLPLDLRFGADLNAAGNLAGEIKAFLNAGMDGFFTDNPDIGAEVTLPEEALPADAAGRTGCGCERLTFAA